MKVVLLLFISSFIGCSLGFRVPVLSRTRLSRIKRDIGTTPVLRTKLRDQTVFGSTDVLQAPNISGRIAEQPTTIGHRVVDALVELLNDENSGDISRFVTQSAKLFSKSATVRFWKGIVLRNPSFYSRLHSRTLATAMFSLCRCFRHDIALEVFEQVLLPRGSVEVVAYQAAARAAAVCRPFSQIIRYMEECYEQYYEGVLDLVESVLNDLCHAKHRAPVPSIQIAQEVYNWLVSKSLRPTDTIMEHLLTIACARGSVADVDQSLQYFDTYDIVPSMGAFQKLLQKFAAHGERERALSVLQRMHEAGQRADITTYNALLLLFINIRDIKEAEKVVSALQKNAQDSMDTTTLQLMLRLAAVQGAHMSDCHTLRSAESSGTVSFSTDAFLSALKASTSVDETQALLRLAEDLCLDNEEVQLAAVQSCSKVGADGVAFELLGSLIDTRPRETPVEDLYRALFALHDRTSGELREEILHRLSQFTTACSTTCSAKMTEGVWRKLVVMLCERKHSMLAAALVSDAIAVTNGTTAGAQVVSFLLNRLSKTHRDHLDKHRDSAEVFGDQRLQASIEGALFAESALKVVKAYCAAQPSSLVTDDDREQWALSTARFNAALVMLGRCGLHREVRDLFHIMRGTYDFTADNPVQSSSFTRNTSSLCVPTTFTVAEVVRSARSSGDLALGLSALAWAMENLVYLPVGVISDLLSLMYSEGHRETTTALYRQLYVLGHITHWETTHTGPTSNQSSPSTPRIASIPDTERRGEASFVMDLHGFSRGMAFAALHVAIDEIRAIVPTARDPSCKLTIITGRGKAPRTRDAYILSGAVQEILTEDFYPPIASSTVPRNTGRLAVNFADIFGTTEQ